MLAMILLENTLTIDEIKAKFAKDKRVFENQGEVSPI